MTIESQTNNEQNNNSDQYIIPINSLFEDFKKHLDIPNNNRIVISGRFGIGKTYFLKEFFKEYKEEYEVFHLYPVNYQISKNEDIVDFLKYDILTHLIIKFPEVFKENQITDFLDLQNLLFMWGKDNSSEIIKNCISMIPKLGKPLKDGISLIERFNEFKRKYKCGEKGVVDDYLKNIKDKKYEEVDNISHLISEKVKVVKEKRRSVLILDDLERIDPEHIFRILNSFSSCFDLHNKDINKFNFDRIILVSDYNNLQSIFHHRYGKKTDFSGYFDKFCSIELYPFNNESITEKLLKDIVRNFKISNKFIKNQVFQKSTWFRLFLSEVLGQALNISSNNKLNLRQLLKGTKFEFEVLSNNADLDTDINGREEYIPFFVKVSIKVLLSIVGGSKYQLLSLINDIKEQLGDKNDNEKGYDEFCEHMLIEMSKSFKLSRAKNVTLQYDWENLEIYYNPNKIEGVRIKGDISKKMFKTNYLFYILLYRYINLDYHTKQYDPMFERVHQDN